MKSRVISALVLAPLFIGSMVAGGYLYLFAVMLICGICAWEFGNIYNQDVTMRIPMLMLAITVEVLILARWFSGVGLSHRTLTFCIMAAMVWGVLASEQQIPHAAMSFAVLVTGMVYIGWLGGYMVSLRQMDQGLIKLLLAFALTWSTDVWAFFVGRSVGKHKMLPVVSPKKTWEGYIGGVVLTIATAALMERFIPAVASVVNTRQITLMALMISALCPIGDFGESMIKRAFGVKDSSHMIPGHGGFFDRFDSVFFSMPMAYYFFEAVAMGMV